MSDDAQRWKTKYLESLEQQEQLERRWDARLDLLRRGVVRSSLAAEGSDKAVDQCMQELREIVRSDAMDAGLAALIPRLERAVLDSEQRRQERVVQTTTALHALVGQLQDLPLPRELRKPLKKFAKQLEERASQARELPALLGELSGLQRQALALLESPEKERPGLWQRLFGHDTDPSSVVGPASSGSEETAESVALAPLSIAPAAAPLDVQSATGSSTEIPPITNPQPALAGVEPLAVTEAVSAPPLENTLSPAPVAITAAAPQAGLAETSQSQDPAYALPSPPEPGYSAIAEHVEATLLGLLDELLLPERHQPQAEALRERIQAGLNWYELVPVLDDFAVLMLALADVGQHEFEGYLKQLNERLATFQAGLQDAHTGYADSVAVARELDSELRQQVDGLHSSVQEATNLDSLKLVVETRLEGLLSTMDQYQRQRDEQEKDVAERLQTLVERVASMEQEAKGFREHIEEQRQKALSDPLTGLPNRAAWSERLDLEVARWQRYGGDLLLAVLDIDHFKRINDNYGHLAGDKVLKIIAGELSKRLRKTDFIARFGGEEFVLLIPSTPLDGGRQLLETLRAAIEACPFHFKNEPVTITFSAGITAFSSGERHDQVFERADQTLYRAKRNGRNRVEVG